MYVNWTYEIQSDGIAESILTEASPLNEVVVEVWRYNGVIENEFKEIPNVFSVTLSIDEKDLSRTLAVITIKDTHYRRFPPGTSGVDVTKTPYLKFGGTVEFYNKLINRDTLLKDLEPYKHLLNQIKNPDFPLPQFREVLELEGLI